jgi:hypothetical protein
MEDIIPITEVIGEAECMVMDIPTITTHGIIHGITHIAEDIMVIRAESRITVKM